MKYLLTFMGLFGLCLASSNAQIIYVSAGANGNGQSWVNPIGSLQAALYLAEAGTQIWVAQGTYLPVDCENCSPDDRKVSFKIPSGVKVYGGFAGNETALEERQWRSHATQLSGDIGRDDLFDNSYSIVTFENVSAETVLDGFFIVHGYADEEEGRPGNPHRSGGGIFNQSTQPGKASEPTISHCIFMENFAWEGGGIFNLGRMGRAIVNMDGCAFVGNHGFSAGGAFFDDNPETGAVSNIANSRFVRNGATFGGAYFSSMVRGEKTVFQSCHFVANESKAGAAGFTLVGDAETSPRAFHDDCFFKNNHAETEGDFFIQKGKTIPEQIMGDTLWTDL